MSFSLATVEKCCRQSGAYVDRIPGIGGDQSKFYISQTGVFGMFSVDGNVIKVLYQLVDPSTDQNLPPVHKTFTDLDAWSTFCDQLQDPAQVSLFFAHAFDPSLLDDEGVTETERLQRVRVGQAIYRRRLEVLWGKACAVTGVTQPELLRASHAKPWAVCESGAERLSPYNGFLLHVGLDALFDKYLITFKFSGRILISPHVDAKSLGLLGIDDTLRLRQVYDEHKPFLAWHRERFEALNAKDRSLEMVNIRAQKTL